MATRLLKILFEFFYLYVLYALLHTLYHCTCWATMLHSRRWWSSSSCWWWWCCPVATAVCPGSRSALPCPAVCLGHKSKEQIAAAKAVKANKPKCRRNKLANVMDAATQGELELEQAGKQGVVFSWSCAMFLTLSSFSLLSAVAKMWMQMLMHCPIEQVSPSASLCQNYSYNSRVGGTLPVPGYGLTWGLVNLSCSSSSSYGQKGPSRTFYTTSFPHAGCKLYALLCHRLWPTSIGLNSLWCTRCPSLALCLLLPPF